MSTKTLYYIGVDVGTGSARACLVDASGHIAASDTQDTKTWRDENDHRIFEQSTTDIWSKICLAVKKVLSKSGVDKSAIKGLGFDATCSLAVTDFDGNPVLVTKGKDIGNTGGERNIILWADHRAEKEAELINSTESIVLNYVGGTMSLEMEVPKILWLKQHMDPGHFSRCQFFDLPDYFTYKCTGDNARSFCSTTCKCSFVPDKGWQEDFFTEIGLAELIDGGEWRQMGAAKGRVKAAGIPIGQGLTEDAAKDLGLLKGTAVGSGLIDAYAGWMGTVGARYTENGTLSEAPALDESRHRLAAVAGTSTCHLVQSKEGVFVNGVWGPYRDAAFPGWWMNEGGQSSTGQLIDFVITTHTAYPELKEKAREEQKNIHQVLLELLEKLRQESHVESFTELTKDIHFYPDFHGNRSPIADPRMRGAIIGLELDASITDLAKKYYLVLESIALQTRHIIESMNSAGHDITSIYLSGGQARNIVLMQLFADTCGIPMVLPASHSEAVVLGAAMLARIAAEKVTTAEQMWKIMVDMTLPGTLVAPAAPPKVKKLLDAKYKIFRETIEIQQRWRQEMEEAAK
ncbi:D-ribulokinase [Paxillus involutus ATCC 200175]|nr:D-ribulokinase [Paxillus involutus ATCC 200175]